MSMRNSAVSTSWSVMKPSPVDQLYLNAPYVMLCDYIRTERGLDRCPYLPEG